MAHHFNEKGSLKKDFDNFRSAKLECNKYNSKVENLGKKKKVPYKCRICKKVHIGEDNKKTLTLNVRDKAFEQLNSALNKSILIKKIKV